MVCILTEYKQASKQRNAQLDKQASKQTNQIHTIAITSAPEAWNLSIHIHSNTHVCPN